MMRLTESQLESAHALWDELSDFGAPRTDDALRHLMQRLNDWFDTMNVAWLGAARISRGAAARRDPQSGWRVLVIRHHNPDPGLAERAERATRRQGTDPGMTTRALVTGIGRFRVHCLHDGTLVDMSTFRRTPHYRTFYVEAGIADRMYVGMPINADTESLLLLDRVRGSPRFTAAEAEFAAYVIRGLKWFQREILLSHGLLLACQPLSAVERRIVSLHLTDRTEKEIAAEIGQTPKTTHKYITGILRKFGVRGRTGLMALWLGRRS